jgi:hypothetical protein
LRTSPALPDESGSASLADQFRRNAKFKAAVLNSSQVADGGEPRRHVQFGVTDALRRLLQSWPQRQVPIASVPL